MYSLHRGAYPGPDPATYVSETQGNSDPDPQPRLQERKLEKKQVTGQKFLNFFLTLKENGVADPHSFVRIRIGNLHKNLDPDSKGKIL